MFEIPLSLRWADKFVTKCFGWRLNFLKHKKRLKLLVQMGSHFVQKPHIFDKSQKSDGYALKMRQDFSKLKNPKYEGIFHTFSCFFLENF